MKKKKIGKWYLCVGGAVILFLLTVVVTCYYFYQRNTKLEAEVSKKVAAKAEKKDEDRLYLEYIGLENIPFLKGEKNFVKRYEKYIKEELGLTKVHTTIFFSNYEKISENTYLLYSQIDDAASTVLQSVCNIKTHTYDFSKCEKPIEKIEDLGGVVPGGKQSLSDKYKTEEKAGYANVKTEDGVKTGLDKAELDKFFQTIQRYAYEKYKNTDIDVTQIKLMGATKSGDYQILTFELNDLVKTQVEIYYNKELSIYFTIER